VNGPDDVFRESIYQRLQEMRTPAFDDGERVTPETENTLGDVLEQILGQTQVAVRDSTILNPELDEDQQGDVLVATRPTLEEFQTVLVAVDEWASVASYAVSWLYAPASPLPARMAGWGGKAIEILRQIAGCLRTPLKFVAIGLEADSYSISVGFPWGVSVTLDWPSSS
jgi:hypothetical protein